MAKFITGAKSKKHVVLRNRKRSDILLVGCLVLLRIRSELPVIGSRLTPDNLIVNRSAGCRGRIPLERGVVIQVGRHHTHVLWHTRRRRQGGQGGDVPASNLRNIAKFIELQQVAVFNPILYSHVLMLMIVVLSPLGKPDRGKPLSTERTMVSPAQKAVESKFHDSTKCLGVPGWCGASAQPDRGKVRAVRRENFACQLTGRW